MSCAKPTLRTFCPGPRLMVFLTGMNETDRKARRAFLKGLAGGALGGALGAAGAGFLMRDRGPSTTVRSPRSSSGRGLKGRVFALGAEGRLASEAFRRDPALVDDRQAMASMLSWIDLADGSSGRQLLDVGGGHSVCALDDGRVACLGQNAFWGRPSPLALVTFTRGRSKPEVVYVQVPSEARTLGHGLFDLDRERLYVGALRGQGADEKGVLLVVDPARARIESEIGLAGLRPHDLAFADGGREVVVCQYGEKPRSLKNAPSYSGQGAGLAFYAREDFRHLRTLQGSRSAPVSHLTFDERGDVYFLQHQGFSWRDEHARSRETYDLASADLFDRFINEPLPLLRARPEKVDEFWGRREGQRRGLSIAFNRETRRVIATFSASDSFMVFDVESEESWVFDGADAGLLNVCGAVALPGSPLVALSGYSHHLSLFDTRELRMTEVHKVAFHGASHLSYLP